MHLARALASNTSLQILSLESNEIGLEGATALAVVLGADGDDEGRYVNSTAPTAAATTTAAAATTTAATTTNKTLLELWLRNNLIGDDGADQMGQVRASNRS